MPTIKNIKTQLAILPAILLVACGSNNNLPSRAVIDSLHLKEGQVIVCGTPDKEFGVVNFDITSSEQVKNDF